MKVRVFSVDNLFRPAYTRHSLYISLTLLAARGEILCSLLRQNLTNDLPLHSTHKHLASVLQRIYIL